MRTWISITVVTFLILMILLCLANGAQRIIAYGDWPTGITNLGIGAVLLTLLAIGWIEEK